MSKCLWIEWKWYWGVNEILSPFPCSPVIREHSRKKTQIEKTTKKISYLSKYKILIFCDANVCWKYMFHYSISSQCYTRIETSQLVYHPDKFGYGFTKVEIKLLLFTMWPSCGNVIITWTQRKRTLVYHTANTKKR